MQIMVNSAADVITVSVSGELDLYGAQILTSTLAELFPRGRPIAVDVSGVDFIDCAAIAALEGSAATGQILGVPVRIAEPGPVVSRILALAGVPARTRSATAFPPA
jgi:anti-anti-sigma factor